jgi:plasmid stabilization system protein ParE
MKIVILRSAIEDLVRGREFYEKQDEGLGAYFEDSLAADIDSLRLFASIHNIVLGYHRMLSTKFPYAVYYEIVGEQIRIRAVLDCRRDPKWIHTRLQR